MRISSITRGIGLYHHPHLLEGGETDVLAAISRDSAAFATSLYRVSYSNTSDRIDLIILFALSLSSPVNFLILPFT